MKRRFKLMSLMLVLTMTVSLVPAGCGSSSSDSGDTGSSDDSSATSDEASDEGESSADTEASTDEIVDITMAYCILNTAAPDMRLVEDAINKITEPEIGVHVNIEAINIGDYLTQVNLMFSSGEDLDIVHAFVNNFSSWHANGSIVSFDDEMQQYGQGIIEAIGEDYLKAGQINGQQYGITTNRDLATGYGFAFRTDLLEKYNIDPDSITSLEDVEAALAAIHKNEPSIVPLTIQSEGGEMFSSFKAGMDPLGDYLGVLMDMTDESLKCENLFESDRYKEFVNKMHDWYQKGYIQSDVATSSEIGAILLRSGGAFAETVTTKPGLDTQITTETDYPMTIVEVYPPDTCTTTVQTLQYVIAKNSEHVDKAIQFLNLLYTSPDVANLLAWGIEGTHYVVTEDGHITFPDGIDSSNSGYNLVQGWLVGNQFITHVWEGDDLDIWDQLDAFNKAAMVSKAMGFTFNTEKVKTEYAACSAVLEQYRCSLECGSLDPDSTIEEFNKALYAAGLQTIIDEKQRQLDEWAANN